VSKTFDTIAEAPSAGRETLAGRGPNTSFTTAMARSASTTPTATTHTRLRAKPPLIGGLSPIPPFKARRRREQSVHSIGGDGSVTPAPK
jgi:hypothetical protein